MKVIINTCDLKRLVKATAKFISKDDNRPLLQYIRLDFNMDDCSVKAVALDGYRMAVEYAKCISVDESFSAYIKPYLPVGAFGDYAVIEINKDSCLIDIDGRIVGYKQPAGVPFDDVKIISDMESIPVTFKVGINPQYLIDALNSAKFSIGNVKEPLIIEYRGEVTPLTLRINNGKRIILPVRMKE